MARIALILALLTVVLVGLAACGSNGAGARFAATPATGRVPIEVQFTDLSQGDIDTWEWDFDDDGVVDSTLKNPRWFYRDPGVYTISLTVSGSGDTDTETKIAYVDLAPPLSQAGSSLGGCCGSASSSSSQAGCSGCQSGSSQPVDEDRNSGCGCN